MLSLLLGINQDFLGHINHTLKLKKMLGLIRINNFCFCTMKETISKVKRQPSEREEVRANKAADQEIISKI